MAVVPAVYDVPATGPAVHEEYERLGAQIEESGRGGERHSAGHSRARRDRRDAVLKLISVLRGLDQRVSITGAPVDDVVFHCVGVAEEQEVVVEELEVGGRLVGSLG